MIAALCFLLILGFAVSELWRRDSPDLVRFRRDRDQADQLRRFVQRYAPTWSTSAPKAAPQPVSFREAWLEKRVAALEQALGEAKDEGGIFDLESWSDDRRAG